MIVILHLRLGQGRLARRAPVNGLLALVDEALFDKGSKLPCYPRFVGISHGEVRVFPVPEDAQALEFIPLDVDVLFSILAAGAPDLEGGQPFFPGLEL